VSAQIIPFPKRPSPARRDDPVTAACVKLVEEMYQTNMSPSEWGEHVAAVLDQARSESN
jgi:hypothetical protein